LGPFLINANLDGATKNRQITSKVNHVTHIVSRTKNIQENRVSLPECNELYCWVVFTIFSNDSGGSLRMDGSVSIINDAIDTIIITIEIIATTRAALDDSGHSNTSQIVR
jgi:hypothetical protein